MYHIITPDDDDRDRYVRYLDMNEKTNRSIRFFAFYGWFCVMGSMLTDLFLGATFTGQIMWIIASAVIMICLGIMVYVQKRENDSFDEYARARLSLKDRILLEQEEKEE